MDKVLTEPGFLKLSSSILTINHHKSVKVPEFTIISFEIQHEYLLVPVLGCGTHFAIPFTPQSYSAYISIANSPNDHIPNLFGSWQVGPLLENSRNMYSQNSHNTGFILLHHS